MASLRLAIDASGMRQGAQEAEQALRRVDTAAQAATTQVDRVNRVFGQSADIYGGGARVIRDVGQTFDATATSANRLQKSFGLATEAISIGARVRGITSEFSALRAGMGDVSQIAILTAQSLLDVAQAGARLRDLRVAEEAGKAATSAGGLVRLLATNPLVLAATAIGALAAAMALFGKNTENATKAQESFKQALADQQKSGFLDRFNAAAGLPSSPSDQQTRAEIDRLRNLAADLRGNKGAQFSAKDVSASLGISAAELTRISEQTGIAPTLVDARGAIEKFITTAKLGGARFEQQFSGDQIGVLAAQRAAELNSRAGNAQYGPPQADRSQVDAYLDSLRTETDLLGQQEEMRNQNIAVLQAEQLARQAGVNLSEQEVGFIREQITLQQQLTEARQLGQDTFAALGTGLFAAATGASSLRQALAGVVQQLVQIAQSRFVQQFANLGGSLFASTGAQMRDPGIGGVGGLRAGEAGPTMAPGYTP